MPKHTVGEKAHRAVDFLMGVTHWQVQRAMAPFGFGQRAVDEGWARLRNLTTDKLQTGSSLIDPRLVGALDAWEHRYYPVIEVVLRTNHPDIHAKVFQNLRQTEGNEVMVSVPTLLDRLATIEKPEAEGGFGDLGTQARTPARRARRRRAHHRRGARHHRADRHHHRPPPPGSTDPEAAALAEERLWNWYIEWSAIARVAIRDRRLLRLLGFLRTVKKANGEEEEVIVNDDDLDDDLETEPPPPVRPTDTDPNAL